MGKLVANAPMRVTAHVLGFEMHLSERELGTLNPLAVAHLGVPLREEEGLCIKLDESFEAPVMCNHACWSGDAFCCVSMKCHLEIPQWAQSECQSLGFTNWHDLDLGFIGTLRAMIVPQGTCTTMGSDKSQQMP